MQLLTKLNKVKHDSEMLAVDLENEEECLTNNLQRQLRILKTEKEGVEGEVGDLKKQLENMKVEREMVSLYIDMIYDYLYIQICIIY
jgi:hypothetical protein